MMLVGASARKKLETRFRRCRAMGRERQDILKMPQDQRRASGLYKFFGFVGLCDLVDSTAQRKSSKPAFAGTEPWEERDKTTTECHRYLGWPAECASFLIWTVCSVWQPYEGCLERLRASFR